MTKKLALTAPFFTLLGALLVSANAQAVNPAGREGGNGGDACEKRFQAVRDDLHLWIGRGGAAALILPSGTNLETYVNKMSSAIEEAKISCVSGPLRLGRAEKTCLNFVDERGVDRIECNAERFLKTTEEDQYVLVHHEYAGLAKLEANDGDEASRYEISNQVSGSLEEATIKRLVIRNPADKFDRLRLAFGDFLGTYEILDCSVSTNDSTSPRNPNRPDACQAKTLVLSLSERFLAKYGYRTVDTEFHGIPGSDGQSYNIAFANDGRQGRLGKGYYFSAATDDRPLELETSVRVVGETYFFQTNRVLKTPGHEGQFTRVTVIAKRVR